MTTAMGSSKVLLSMEESATNVDDCGYVQGATRSEFGSRSDLHEVSLTLCSSSDVNVARLGLHALGVERERDPGPIDDPDHPHMRAAPEILDRFRDDVTAWHIAYSLSCSFGASVNELYERLISDWSYIVRLQVAVNISAGILEDSSVEVGGLIRRLLTGPHPSPRRFAVSALAGESAAAFPWRLEELQRAATDSNERVRAEAFEALQGLGASGSSED